MAKTDRYLTSEVVAAWKRCDYLALHSALGLRPWNASPLPEVIHALGCDQDPPREWMDSLQRRDWRNAQAMQRALLKFAGWPDCRAAYEENLREAVEWAAYCKELVDYPERDHSGTNSDPASRQRALQEAEENVAYRKELLAGLE